MPKHLGGNQACGCVKCLTSVYTHLGHKLNVVTVALPELLLNRKLIQGANIANLTKNDLSESNFMERFYFTKTQIVDRF